MTFNHEASGLGLTLMSPTSGQTTTLLNPEAHRPEKSSAEIETHAVPGPDDRHLPMPALPWRPPYLRRTVIAIFFLIFALVLVAIEVLRAVSARNDGIANAMSEQHYLWTYGPTAFLTLLAAYWARAEYQSKLVAPWLHLAGDPVKARRSLLLDYISDFQLFVIVKALGNGDYTVAMTSAVSVLIKVLIVISTGLITLSPTFVNFHNYPIEVYDVFKHDGSRLRRTTAGLPTYVMSGLLDGNLTLPNGISPVYAFQSVGDGLNFGNGALTVAAVQGLTNTLDCVPADVVMKAARGYDPHVGNLLTMNLTVSSASCNLQQLGFRGPSGDFTGRVNSSTVAFARFMPVQCDGQPDEKGTRLFAMYGNITFATDFTRNSTDYTGAPTHPVNATLNRSTQLLCTPSYHLIDVEVRRNGTVTDSVEPIADGVKTTMDSVSAVDLMHAVFDSYNGSALFSTGGGYARYQNISKTVRVDVDVQMADAVRFKYNDTTKSNDGTELFDHANLEGLVTPYYRQMTAVIAKESLMAPSGPFYSKRGSVTGYQPRLVVQDWAAQWMASLVAVCIVLVILTWFTVPRRGILPCNPSTLPAAASILLHSYDLLALLCYSGATDEMALRSFLESYRFRTGAVRDAADGQVHFGLLTSHESLETGRTRSFPQIKPKPRRHGLLHPVNRLIMALVFVGLIVTLEVLLRKSDREDGLGDVKDDAYLHYTWTTLPSLFLGTFTMVLSSVDFRVVSLVPYFQLRRPVPVKDFMKLDFLDMTIPRRIFKEVKMGNMLALASTSTLMIASLFTIFSGSLFQALPVTVQGTYELRPTDSFPAVFIGDAEDPAFGVYSSLILETNLTYSPFTWENLAFPRMTMDSIDQDYQTHQMESWSPTYTSVIPAIRPKLDCRVYDASHITVNYTKDYTSEIWSHNNPLSLRIEGEDCALSPNSSFPDNIVLSTYSNATYFARGDGVSHFSDVQGCSNMLWAWGKFDFSKQPPLANLASLACNVSYETVDVDVTYRLNNDTALPTWTFDRQNPPQPREATARMSTLSTAPRKPTYEIDDDVDWQHTEPTALWTLYRSLAEVDSLPDLLDPFFTMLTDSPWAIPIEKLGDASATKEIVDAIQFQHNIIMAQMLSSGRVPANTTNVTLAIPFDAKATDAEQTYLGFAKDQGTRQRVKQDHVSTRVLEALLGFALLLFLGWWALMPESSTLPARSPTTIAAVAALVAGGNLPDILPPDAEGRSRHELAAALGLHSRFWLGWANMPDDDSKHGGFGNQDGTSRFGIFAVREDGEKL